MTTQGELPLLVSIRGGRKDRQHDLPPAWDGRKVRWEPWREPTHSASMDAHLGEEVCTECGTLAPRPYTRGLMDPAPGETETVTVTKRTHRTRRAYRATEQRAARPRYHLIALRCQHCRTDTVIDLCTHEQWVLDDTDYGDQGSHNPQTGQP
jgi:hypothetical protein